MLIVSSDIVSPGDPGLLLFFVVIFTVRRAVFICGETEVMVPCTIVPSLSSIVTVSLAHFIRNLYKPCQLLVAETQCSRKTAQTIQMLVLVLR